MGSTNYAITTTVISCGGAPMGSGSLNSNATVGQPSPITYTSSNSGSELFSGFWHTLTKSSCFWDFELDGDVDGFDLLEFRLGFGPDGYNATDLESFRNEFGRIDCLN